MRHQQARRPPLARSKAQTPPGRQIDLIENAERQRQARSPQALFKRIQCVSGTRRLNDDKPRWIKPETNQTRSRKPAEFTGHRPRPAPHHPRLADTSTG
jgi:hypothetical protein